MSPSRVSSIVKHAGLALRLEPSVEVAMSLLIANLAFFDPELLEASKIGILAASLVSGLAGSWVLVRAGRTRPEGTSSKLGTDAGGDAPALLTLVLTAPGT